VYSDLGGLKDIEEGRRIPVPKGKKEIAGMCYQVEGGKRAID